MTVLVIVVCIAAALGFYALWFYAMQWIPWRMPAGRPKGKFGKQGASTPVLMQPWRNGAVDTTRSYVAMPVRL